MGRAKQRTLRHLNECGASEAAWAIVDHLLAWARKDVPGQQPPPDMIHLSMGSLIDVPGLDEETTLGQLLRHIESRRLRITHKRHP